MTKYLQETTNTWICDYRVPNHTYIVSGMKAVGYIKEGTSEEIMFKKPMFFDRKGRTFKELKNGKS